MKNSLDDLIATLEKIRKEKYPQISSEAITEIVEAQMANQDNPTKRQTETLKIIDRYAGMIKSEEGGGAK